MGACYAHRQRFREERSGTSSERKGREASSWKEETRLGQRTMAGVPLEERTWAASLESLWQWEEPQGGTTARTTLED